jgi:two-component system heavy metal sensor histidine kinase CusS
MQLSRRLTLSLSSLTLATLAGSFGVAYLLVSREQIRDLDAALRTEAGVVSALIWQDPAAVATLNAGNVPMPDPLKDLQSYAVAYDAEGKPIIWTKDSLPKPPTVDSFDINWPLSPEGTAFNFTYFGRHLRAIVIPVASGKARRLFVAVSRAGVEDDMAYLLRLFASLMAVAMLSTVGIASWVGRRVARDVQRIAIVARQVAEGDLGARLGQGRFGSSELQSLASDLDHMVAKLAELVSAHKVFASYAAHELRSPLAALRGELQLALRRQRSVGDYELVLSSVLEDVEGLISLAEDLLTLARVQGTAGTSPNSQVSDIVQDAVRVVNGIAQMRSIDILVKGCDKTLTVPGRRPDLTRVVRNLLENAVSHSPDGEPVTLDVSSNSNTVTLAMSDSGQGIPAEDQPHVFQPFFRGATTHNNNRSGAGLGLAIARGIIEAHGGTINLDVNYTGGARFIVVLPRVEVET